MLVLRQLTYELLFPPDIESAPHGFRSGGGAISMEQPSACKTWRAFPIWTVVLPASSSTTKRNPTPAAPASSSWRRFCAFRTVRTIAPISAGVRMRFSIFFPERENNRVFDRYRPENCPHGKFFQRKGRKRESSPLGKDLSDWGQRRAEGHDLP